MHPVAYHNPILSLKGNTMPESPRTMVIGATQKERRINLEIGKEYVIGPNSEHGGRRAILLEFVPYHPDKPDDLVARVSFSDDHRFGRVEISDLWEVGQIPEKPRDREKIQPTPQQPQPYWKSRAKKASSNPHQANTRKYRP